MSRKNAAKTGSNGPRRAVLYARISKSDDASHSLRSQMTTMRGWCTAFGCEVAAEVIDDGCSAGSLDRPGVDTVRALVGAGEVDALVVVKLDRLSRRVRDMGDMLDMLRVHDVALVSCSENIDSGSAAGMLYLNVISSVAEWELSTIRERTRAGLAQARRDGKHIGRVPFGFRPGPAGLQRDDDEQRALRLMRRLRKRGYSFADIAHELHRRGVPTKTGLGAWQPKTVARLVTA